MLVLQSSDPISIEENRPNGTIMNPNVRIIAQDPDTTAKLKFKIDWDKSEARKDGIPTPKKEYVGYVCISLQVSLTTPGDKLNNTFVVYLSYLKKNHIAFIIISVLVLY